MKTMKKARTKKSRRASTSYASLRRALISRRQDLLDRIHGGLADSRRDTRGARFDDVADRASDALYNELAQGFAEIATADLRKIDMALERIEMGTYGHCEECGCRIPQARLRMLPFADLCVACQRELEKSPGPTPRSSSVPNSPDWDN